MLRAKAFKEGIEEEPVFVNSYMGGLPKILGTFKGGYRDSIGFRV